MLVRPGSGRRGIDSKVLRPITIGFPIVRAFNRSIQLWLVFWALGGFAYFGLQGGLLNLYLLRLGFGPQFIGLLVGFGEIAGGVAALPAAAFGRRVGLRTAQQAG